MLIFAVSQRNRARAVAIIASGLEASHFARSHVCAPFACIVGSCLIVNCQMKIRAVSCKLRGEVK